MSTANASPIKIFDDKSIEKIVYSVVEKYNQYIPVKSDRYRLSYNIVNNLDDDSDPLDILFRAAKIKVQGIDEKELIQKLTDSLNESLKEV